MNSAIEELWNGQVAPAACCGVGDPEIENLIILIERHKDQLNKELKEQDKSIFEKYVDCAEEYTCLISQTAFRDGFMLAVKLMAEALSNC